MTQPPVRGQAEAQVTTIQGLADGIEALRRAREHVRDASADAMTQTWSQRPRPTWGSPIHRLGDPADRHTVTRREPARSEVELWWTFTNRMEDDTGAIAVLDADERARAERYRSERDRARFIHRHAFARRILAGYLSVEPAEIPIRVSPRGRPSLGRSSRLHFSTSHADDLAVVAVARGRRVGVDIEHIRPIDGALEIAEGLFANQEIALLRSTSGASRNRVFLELWTRKESFVKAAGGGLSIPLDRFDVVARGGGAVTRSQHPFRLLPFTIAQFVRPDGHVGAVTLAGEHVEIHDMGSEVALR